MVRRVCLVTTELRAGGAEQCLVRVACGLDRSRFAPRVVSLLPPPSGDAPLLSRLEEAQIPIDFLGVRRSIQLPQAVRRLGRRLRDESTELVQSFLFHANVASLLAAGRRLPVVVGIRVAEPRRWRHWIEKPLARRAAAIACVSNSVAEFCRRRGYRAEQLEVIPNGIDCQALPAEPLLPPQIAEQPMLLYVGRLHRQKGLDWMFRLVGALFHQIPHHLVLAGDGPQRSELEHLAGALGIRSRVHFLGHRPDALRLIAACGALLLPSRWEGMPNVVMEAMASARPVIATPAEGVRELLGERLAALQTAAFGDDNAWLERIQEAAGPQGNQWGAANRERVCEHFSLPTMLQRYESLYDRILG